MKIKNLYIEESILGDTSAKKIEQKLGRTKAIKNDPRVIDIDIVDFNSKIKKYKK